jgi:hypothetical protein
MALEGYKISIESLAKTKLAKSMLHSGIIVASGYMESLNDCGQCVSLAKASSAG